MSQFEINVPVIVKRVNIENTLNYLIRPLFFSYPTVSQRRFEKAEQAFRKELKYYFQNYKLTRENLANHLWYKFKPNVKYQIEYFEFDLGKQYVRNNFAYAEFVIDDKKIIFLPHFNNYMFILALDEDKPTDIKKAVVEIIIKLLKREKKNQGGGTLNLEAYISAKNEFITAINCKVKIESEKYPFEADDFGLFFEQLSTHTDFDGATELYKVGNDLNERFPVDLLSAWYREGLVKRIGTIVFSEEHTPFVLVGEEGVGKKSIIHEALYRYIRINENEDKEHLQKIWHIDPTRIIAGMSIVGMWQKRLESILKFIDERRSYNKKIKDSAKDKILFDNAVALLRIGKSSQNNMTLSDVLKPYLEKRLIQIILVATPEEWKVVQEKDRRFSDLFQVIRVEPPSAINAAKMVLQQRKLLELEYATKISSHAIHKLFTIHRNYFQRYALPGGVMRLLNQMALKYKHASIDIPEVEKEFEDFSGLKSMMTDDAVTFNEKDVRDNISVKLVGQPHAVTALTDVIHNVKAKIVHPDKPNGSFLFIGPTGVGKTQAAKVLSEFMLGREDQLMRFDMNEYIDEYAVSRLIGDQYNPEGYLTGKVRYNPFGIVLLDEIEKAHPKVHDLLLQVLDDGRLTDSLGRTVDFSNTIIIMTSNIGANQVSSRVGFGHIPSTVDAVYKKAVSNYFRPEFVNRIDKVTIFKPLELDNIIGIARLQINELLKRDGFVRRTTILNISEKVLMWVANRGFDKRMGGRALKRQIEKDLTSLSADQLLDTDCETPIILDIVLENNRLFPKITPLEFQEVLDGNWLPILPKEKSVKRFYNDLLRVIEKIENDIKNYEYQLEHDENYEDNAIIIIGGENEDLDWQYYDFKDRLVNVKEKVKDTMLGFRDNFFKGGPAIPLRLKGGGLGSYVQKSTASTKGYRQLLKDKLFQEQALNELNEFYKLATDQFDSLNTEYIDNYLEVAFFAAHAKGFLSTVVDEIEITYQSCIDGKGETEIIYLMNLHQAFLENAEIQFDINKKAKIISAEAHALYQLLQGERGIHLFYKSLETPLPIRVNVRLLNMDESSDEVLTKVIRLYDLNATLSDLRSGFSNDIHILPQEFKLLIFAGLTASYRADLMRT